MKSIIKIIKIVLLAFLLVGMESCSDDFLEVTPRGSRIAKSTDDYFNILNNFLINTRGASSKINYLGDDVVSLSPYFETGVSESSQKMFRWEDDPYNNDEDGEELNELQNLYMFNKVINEVMDSEGGTEEEKRSILAEARASRAYVHFYIVNIYGKPYNEATAATDLGIPIIKVHDITETNFTRATVKEVYDFIIEDLTEAMPDLPPFYHRNHMSKAAGNFLLGKVYAYMGKFKEALDAFNECSQYIVGTADQPLELWNYNTDLDNEIAYAAWMDGYPFPLQPNMRSSFYTRSLFVFEAAFTNALPIAPEVMSLFDETDHRLKFYNRNAAFGGSPLAAGLYRKNSQIFTSASGELADYYLFRAESKARLGDLAGAIADVEFFRKHRMPEENAAVPAEVTSDQTNLIKFIIDERKKEFILTGGNRWFDMRRLSLDPIFSDELPYIHASYDADGNRTTITLRPERLTLRFPQKVIDQNPGMVNND